MNFLFLIPARKGSKTLPNKNFLPMCGIPLWQHTFAKAKLVEQYIDSMEHIAVVRVSTDAPELVPVEGHVIVRPDELSTDESPIIETIKHAFTKCGEVSDKFYDAVVLLQPTSPNVSAEDIARCVLLYIEREGKHPVVSGYIMRIKNKGKQDTKSNAKHFQRNGAVFVIPRKLIEEGKILDGQEYEVEMPKRRSGDIDTLEDWLECEAIMEHMKRRGEA